LVLAAAVLFGTTGTAQALGADDASPLSVGAVRVVIGGALLVLIAHRLGELRAPAGLPRRAIVLGALGVAGYQLCFFAAVKLTGVAIGTLVAIGSGPPLTGAVGLLRGQRPERRWAIATALAIAGCALLLIPGGDVEVDAAGVVLALGAGASYTAYTLSSKALLDAGDTPAGAMARAFGLGGLLLLPVLPLAGMSWLADPGGLATALYLGIFTTAIAYTLFARGLRELAPTTVVTLVLAEPVTATALGILVLGERPGVSAAIGALLVLAGLLLLAVPRRGGTA
jgi:DME family drug/metabolite transporter